MPIMGLSETERKSIEDASIQEMGRLSASLREIICSKQPEDLLGYFWSKLLLWSQREDAEEKAPSLETIQIILEYIHAAVACSGPTQPTALEERDAAQIIETAEALQAATMQYCMFSSQRENSSFLGNKTSEVEFLAKSNWVLIRGNRYFVLEEEFFEFVLAPHDQILRETYDRTAQEIAHGFQEIADSMRTGHMRSIEVLYKGMEETRKITESGTVSFEDAIQIWQKEGGGAAYQAFSDLFRGGICNVRKHTNFSETLFQDLSYERGENTDFFAPGDFCGTPLRTLPARIKPLIRLKDGFYATDPAFVRDAGYRALQRGLIQRNPAYHETWNKKQKELSEAAFLEILKNQILGAQIFQEVFYRDVDTREWVENDLLILMDDALLQIEVKAGSLAAIESPASNFERHTRAVEELIIKAYKQCERFLKYLDSHDESILYTRKDGRFVESARIKLKDYRLVIPIGLTLESFTPFSTMCKGLPGMQPILGRHPFISLSIEDLFVVRRFLPDTGSLFHYLQVRQNVSGITKANLYDESDHLGAYIKRNRFDSDLREQLSKGADFIFWDSFSEVVDKFFEGHDWAAHKPPQQFFPEEVQNILTQLSKTRSAGWLQADSTIRNLSSDGRIEFVELLYQITHRIKTRGHGSGLLQGKEPLFIWAQQFGNIVDAEKFRVRSVEVANKLQTSLIAIMLLLTENGICVRARAFTVAPTAS
jgi:hypothetical protein